MMNMSNEGDPTMPRRSYRNDGGVFYRRALLLAAMAVAGLFGCSKERSHSHKPTNHCLTASMWHGAGILQGQFVWTIEAATEHIPNLPFIVEASISSVPPGHSQTLTFTLDAPCTMGPAIIPLFLIDDPHLGLIQSNLNKPQLSTWAEASGTGTIDVIFEAPPF